MKEPWILILENNDDDADLILRAIKISARTEHAVFCFDASKALDVLNTAERPPMLVLLSDRLHGMHSLEFLGKLREKETTGFLPVVVLSEQPLNSSISRALSAGANSFICKPVDFDKMMDHLVTILRYWLDINCQPDLTEASLQK